jgi:hypothetical protein
MSEIGISKQNNYSQNEATSQPKTIKIHIPFDSSLNTTVGDDSDIKEGETYPNPYAKQNFTLAKEVTKYRELAQQKEIRIQDWRRKILN